jgi:hypothetical protein
MNKEQQNWMDGLLDCWIVGRQSEAAHPATYLSINPTIHLSRLRNLWFNSVNA